MKTENCLKKKQKSIYSYGGLFLPLKTIFNKIKKKEEWGGRNRSLCTDLIGRGLWYTTTRAHNELILIIQKSIQIFKTLFH